MFSASLCTHCATPSSHFASFCCHLEQLLICLHVFVVGFNNETHKKSIFFGSDRSAHYISMDADAEFLKTCSAKHEYKIVECPFARAVC